jgi:hypothetical protein
LSVDTFPTDPADGTDLRSRRAGSQRPTGFGSGRTRTANLGRRVDAVRSASNIAVCTDKAAEAVDGLKVGRRVGTTVNPSFEVFEFLLFGVVGTTLLSCLTSGVTAPVVAPGDVDVGCILVVQETGLDVGDRLLRQLIVDYAAVKMILRQVPHGRLGAARLDSLAIVGLAVRSDAIVGTTSVKYILPGRGTT